MESYISNLDLRRLVSDMIIDVRPLHQATIYIKGNVFCGNTYANVKFDCPEFDLPNVRKYTTSDSEDEDSPVRSGSFSQDGNVSEVEV